MFMKKNKAKDWEIHTGVKPGKTTEIGFIQHW